MKIYNSYKYIAKTKTQMVFLKFGTVMGSAITVLYLAKMYMTPPSNFDGPPSPEVKEWMEKGGASRRAAELLVWHGVCYNKPGSMAAKQLIDGGGYTWATAELYIRGYKPGPEGWANPVRK